MRHLFISPHPDDAVLSCGGLISQLSSGDDVIVFTVLAGNAPDPLPDSPLIANIHQRWGLGDNPMPTRREEDKAALEMLGAAVVFGDFVDAVYRTDKSGTALYTSDDDLFGDIKAADKLANAGLNLHGLLPFETIYIPLGAGNHIDHMLVRWLALAQLETLPKPLAVFFYEEYPYNSETGEVLHSHAGNRERLSGNAAIETALLSLPLSVEPVIKPLSKDAVELKIEAIQCYRSQISTFWEDAQTMAVRVRDAALAERLWLVD
ncbi:MAG: PIG-L family deacetylase [Chloroflexi bacterium]|nr:PIG-L family deacetylase [Chloroflexota bacterium]